MQQITLDINGKKHQINADPKMPLLWALRDELGLTGTKYGCGKGLCGACTIHLDGQSIRSCQLTLAAIGNRKITTIEGLSSDNSHPVQQAWLAEDVPQCGFCQAGQIMSAVSLLNADSDPSDEKIKSHMSGNLCRCGTYSRIKKAIKCTAEQHKTAKHTAQTLFHEVK